jgi:hypothetical protein
VSEPRLDAALRRALLSARDKREQRGATGDGTVVLTALEPGEALALDGLLSPRMPILPGRPLRIRLSQLEAGLRACGIDPPSAYEAVGGRPLRDLPAERAAAGATRAEFRVWLATHEVAHSRPAVALWLAEAADRGRIRADMHPGRAAGARDPRRAHRPHLWTTGGQRAALASRRGVFQL